MADFFKPKQRFTNLVRSLPTRHEQLINTRIMQTARKLPNRSKRFGVGKEIGGSVYVHRMYADRLGIAVADAQRRLPADFSFDVVKYNYQTGAVSFIQVSDFDAADEPTIGDILTVTESGETRRRSQPRDPEIYHHKWLFVEDAYVGFDVEQSKRRSRAWISLDNIDRKRIGRKSYWEENVVPRVAEPR